MSEARSHDVETPFGKRRPRLAVIETTQRCDHACIFYGSRAGARRDAELTTEEIRDIVSQLAEMGTESVDFSGGETYLRDDWLELIRAVAETRMDCSLITAGRAMTPERARAARAAGLARASVSIDGLESTHDALRRVTGSFRQAFAALQYLRESGVEVGCNTQVSAANWRDLRPLSDLLAKEQLYGWQIQLMIPMGRGADIPDLWLQPFDLLEVVPAIAEVIEHCAELGFRVYAGDNVGYFGPHEAVLRRYTSRDRHSLGCAAGLVAIGVAPNGDVKGCSALDGERFRAGNVRMDALADLWRDAPELNFNCESAQTDLWGYCSTCYYRQVCRAGCPSTSTALFGKPGNNPYCHHRALEHAACGTRERLVRVGSTQTGLRGGALCELHVEACD
jgi:radical SAM protein with 4Fe4S-binding SPASM domain